MEAPQDPAHTHPISISESNAYAKGFKLAHYNVHSLWPKLDSIKLWIDDLDFDIITLSETWLSSSIPNSLLDIDNYDSFHQDRPPGCRGGGLLTLIRQSKNIIYDVAKHLDLCVSTRDAEIQVLEFKAGHQKKMILPNCYRPPSGKVETFIDHIHNILDSFCQLNKFELYICGVFNIPYNQVNPTRCTAQSRSILDLIMTNSAHRAHSGTREINISDHKPVYSTEKERDHCTIG